MNYVQCLMARAALGWSIQHLAKTAGVNYSTVVRFEAGKNIHARSRDKIEATFKNDGAVFFHRQGRFGVSIGVERLS